MGNIRATATNPQGRTERHCCTAAFARSGSRAAAGPPGGGGRARRYRVLLSIELRGRQDRGAAPSPGSGAERAARLGTASVRRAAPRRLPRPAATVPPRRAPGSGTAAAPAPGSAGPRCSRSPWYARALPPAGPTRGGRRRTERGAAGGPGGGRRPQDGGR